MRQLPLCDHSDYTKIDGAGNYVRCGAPANGWFRKSRRYGHEMCLCRKHRYEAVRGYNEPSPLILTLTIREVISLKRWGWQDWVGPDSGWLDELADARVWPA